jgi:hypothetical protein
MVPRTTNIWEGMNRNADVSHFTLAAATGLIFVRRGEESLRVPHRHTYVHSMPSENTQMKEKSERVAESEGMNMSTQNESVLGKAVDSTTTTTTTTVTETAQKMPVVDIEDENEEEIHDEEALFVEIEKEKEKEEAEEAAHPHPHHYDIQSAPKLLQDALKTGAIQTDLDSKDSKAHSTPKKEVKKEPVEGAITAEIDDEKKNEFGDVDAAVDANQEHSPTVAEKVSVCRFMYDVGIVLF